ncbi:MAG: endonuclease III [Holosporaceae bacterium]|jgi:endonuclease-3|nr:endonuclease III [Holosporaceae bacterium]
MQRTEEICKRLAASIPSPHSELRCISDYTFLIAVVLSAQTTDVQVNKVTSVFFKKYKSVDDVLNLGLTELEKEIRSIGLYKTKAKHIIELSKIIKERFTSKVPHSREELESLPGVGRKTANVIMNVLFNAPEIAVDTHVVRLSGRLGFSNKKNPLEIEKDLHKIIPEDYKRTISNLLVLHGRYTCKAQKPDCENCVLKDLCSYRNNKTGSNNT